VADLPARLGLVRRDGVIDGTVVRADFWQSQMRVISEWLTDTLHNLDLGPHNGKRRYNYERYPHDWLR
jgi:hypothetical protein